MFKKFFSRFVKRDKVVAVSAPTAADVAKREVDLAWSETPSIVTRKINRIVLHCSATPNERDIGAAEIRTWHIRDNGWADIGYHFVVRRNGVVEAGRNLNEVGAHTKGHNGDSIGICLIGLDSFSDAQMYTLISLLQKAQTSLALKDRWLYGHYEFEPKKTCPNINMDSLRSSMGVK